MDQAEAGVERSRDMGDCMREVVGGSSAGPSMLELGGLLTMDGMQVLRLDAYMVPTWLSFSFLSNT